VWVSRSVSRTLTSAFAGRPSSTTSSRVDRASRHRLGQRRPDHRVSLPPRALPQRRRVRRPRRRQPAQGEQRPNRASPAQPGRGPSSQPRHPHDRRHADALLPNHPGLPQPTHLDPGDVGQAGSQRNFVPSFRCPTSEQFRNLPLAPRMSGHRVRIGATLLDDWCCHGVLSLSPRRWQSVPRGQAPGTGFVRPLLVSRAGNPVKI